MVAAILTPMAMAPELAFTDLLGSGCTAVAMVGALTVGTVMDMVAVIVAVHTAVMATTEWTIAVKQIAENASFGLEPAAHAGATRWRPNIAR